MSFDCTLSPRLCSACLRHPSACVCPDERLTVRSRVRRPLTNPCVDCGGLPGNIFCPDCEGSGEVV